MRPEDLELIMRNAQRAGLSPQNVAAQQIQRQGFSDPRRELSQRMGGGGFQPSSLIAEGGGLGGALGGAAIGTAILPGVGTLIGAGLGGFLGGTGGSIAEQRIRDKDVDIGEALKFGAIEGITSAGPIKLAKAGKAAYSAVKAGTAVAPAVEKTLSNTLLKRLASKGGEKLEQVGGRLMNTQTNLTRAEMRRIGANTPEMFMKMNSKFGLSKLDDIAEVSKNVTGERGVHSEAVRNVLFNGPGIDTADLRSSLPSILDSKASLVDTATRKRIQTQLDNSIQSMYADQPLNPLANPGAAFDVAKDFRNQAGLLRRGANPSGPEKQLAKVYDTVAGDLEKKLYSQPGVAEALPLVRDNMVKTYNALASQAAGAQSKAYKKLAKEASEIKTVADLRSAQKIWVQASKVDEKTAEAAGNAATKLTGGGGLLSRAGGAILDVASPSVGNVAAKTGRGAQAGASLLQNMSGVPTRATLGAGVASAFTGEETQQPQDDLLSQINQGGLGGTQDLLGGGDLSGLGTTGLGLPQEPQSTEGSAEYYLAGAQRAAAAGDLDSAKQLMAMAETVASLTGPPEISAAQQKGVLSMQNATSQVDQLEQLFNQAGGGQGRIGGAVSGLLGRVGANASAKAYQDKRGGAAVILARALGESGTMTDQDIQRAVDQIPDINATPEEARIKWQSIRQLLAQIGQNTMSVPAASGGGDLLSQMQMGGAY